MSRMQRRQAQQQTVGSRMSRQQPISGVTTKKRHHWGRWVAGIIGVVIVLLVLGVVFFTPLNNAARTASGGKDTVADKAVKTTVVHRLKSAKTGDPTVDNAIDRAANTIQSTRMSTVMQAAKDQDSLTSLLEDKAGLNSAQANTAANAIYSDSDLDGVRADVAKGNWYAVYKQARSLANSQGANLSTIESTLGQ